MRRLSAISYLIRDYDEAIAWFTGVLGFTLIEDSPLGGDKRWVLVAADAAAESPLLLARASGEEQIAQLGRQAGGRVFLFLETDDFERDHQRMRAHGVQFREAPRHEPYGTVAVFLDLYGNPWDLLQRRS
ncbi:VOC family protein [Nevskia sp.]|uniref:VOC family protein n=1 Tax=Nevskia sp. TaxID=1929292 RepID=UPI0025E7C49F|nr:VOC family protein [Nevskia sp.]